MSLQQNLTRNHRKIFNYKLLNIAFHFCRNSTIHGLNHIVNSRSLIQRMFWITICLSASVGLSINMYHLIEKFLERPVLTNIFQDHQLFKYPDISFCFTNPIYFPPENTSQYQNIMDIYRDYQTFKKTSEDLITRITKFGEFLFMRKKFHYSHPRWSAVISCKYLGLSCSYQDFIMRYLYPFGSCFTFNSSIYDADKVHMGGMKRELEMIIYKAVDIPPDTIIDPFESILMPSGVLLMIHDRETWPSIRRSFAIDGYTQLDLKIVHKVHLNIGNKCRQDRNKFDYYDVYTDTNASVYGAVSDCVFENVQIQVARYCRCQWQQMQPLSRYHRLPFCWQGHMAFDVFEKCITKSYNELDNGILDYCYKDDCKHSTFELVVSQSRFPAMVERKTQRRWLEILSELESKETKHYGRSDLFERAIRHNSSGNRSSSSSTYSSITEVLAARQFQLVDEDFIERNFMMVRVIPTSWFTDKVEETEEYPLSRLFSDIGGCIGLWIGASLITIFEFLDLFMNIAESRIFPPARDARSGSYNDDDEDDEDNNHNNSLSVITNCAATAEPDADDGHICADLSISSATRVSIVKISNV